MKTVGGVSSVDHTKVWVKGQHHSQRYELSEGSIRHPRQRDGMIGSGLI